jgi:hypothetical protein
MPWFREQRTWWAPVLWILVIFLQLSVSCATMSSSRKYVGAVSDSKISAKTEESFSSLWEKWTVYLGAGARGGKPLQFFNPLAMTGGMGGGTNEFPLHITATLMDSLLIEAGFQHYATLLTMTPEEQKEFRNAYYRRYDPTNHTLIWCELQTTWAELFLDLNRWLIFIEDDVGNQYEPVQILEESQSSRDMMMDRLPGFQPEFWVLRSEQRRPRWEIHQKTLMLCFPKRDFYKNPILSERSQFLKLVFQLNDDENTRAEGTWVFKK